jgi:hypothetical protein
MTSDSGCCTGGDVRAVWKHPWRKRHRLGSQELLRADEATSTNHPDSHHHKKCSTIQTLLYEDSLCYWTAPVLSPDEEDDNDDWGRKGSDDTDDDDEEPKSRAYHRSESVAHMNTIWNNVGIAVLAQFSLTLDEHRPLVYTYQYIWQLGFPHVATLLLTEDVNESMIMDDDNDDNAKDVQYRRYLCCQQEKQQILGYQLLEWLLSRLPEHELSTPRLTSVHHEPLSPIPVFQLLSNRIVETSSRAAATTTTTSSSVATATTTTVVLPSGYQAYLLMKGLLSKYKLAHQLDLVRRLYKDCPHPGLGPKILDLLRGLLLSLVKSSKGEVEGSDDLLALTTLRLSLWDYLDTLLRDLDGHVACLNTEMLALKASNQDDDKRNNRHSLFPIDSVQEFVADAEKFVSVLTLIRTWMLLVNSNDDSNATSIPDIPQLATRLDAAHKALETMFEHADNDTSAKNCSNIGATMALMTRQRPPEQQLFRLQLLMQALEECIQLLSTSSSS